MNREKQTLMCICLSIFKVLIIHPTNTRHNSSQKFSEGSGHFCPVAVFTSYVCYEWEERQHVNPCSYHLQVVQCKCGDWTIAADKLLCFIEYPIWTTVPKWAKYLFCQRQKTVHFFYQRWGRMKKNFFLAHPIITGPHFWSTTDLQT